MTQLFNEVPNAIGGPSLKLYFGSPAEWQHHPPWQLTPRKRGGSTNTRVPFVRLEHFYHWYRGAYTTLAGDISRGGLSVRVTWSWILDVGARFVEG